jgi:hypothetical protein
VKFALLSAFFMLKTTSAADIHPESCTVYGQNVMSEETIKQWCRMFKDGRKNDHEEQQSSQPYAVCDQKICERPLFTISELSHEFPQISHTVFYKIMRARLG